MTKYGTSLYGTFLYGVATTVTAATPATGPSIGGAYFELTGTGLDPRQWDDEFTAPVLNPALWNDISAGGSITTGTFHLELDTTAVAGSTAGVQSVTTWTNAQGEVRFYIPSVVRYPASDVAPMMFVLDVGGGTYAMMSVIIGTSRSDIRLRCATYIGGVLTDEHVVAWTLGTSLLKILRFNGKILFIANGTVIYTVKSFSNAAAQFEIYSYNGAAAYQVLSTVEYFYFRTFVAFDSEITHNPTVVCDERLRGYTPASIDTKEISAAYAGLVDIVAVGATTGTLADGYEYYFVDRLRVINDDQFGIVLSVIDDDQALSPSTVAVGLGEGK